MALCGTNHGRLQLLWTSFPRKGTSISSSPNSTKDSSNPLRLILLLSTNIAELLPLLCIFLCCPDGGRPTPWTKSFSFEGNFWIKTWVLESLEGEAETNRVDHHPNSVYQVLWIVDCGMQDVSVRERVHIRRVSTSGHHVSSYVADESQNEGKQGKSPALEAESTGPVGLPLAHHFLPGHVDSFLDLHNRYLIFIYIKTESANDFNFWDKRASITKYKELAYSFCYFIWEKEWRRKNKIKILSP